MATKIQRVWHEVLDLDQLSEALSQAISHPRPSLVEIIADPELI